MSRNPQVEEASGLQRLQTWWLELPLSYRVNALLYLLGGAALLVLLSTLFSGSDSPRQIEVGAGVVTTTTARAQPSTTPSTAPAAPSTIAAPTTIPAGVAVPAGSGSSASGATNTSTPTPTQPAGGGGSGTGGGGTGGGDDRGGGGGGGGGGTDNPGITVPSGNTPTCRNSGDERCGAFRWDPPITETSGIGMIVTGTSSARVGQAMNFNVTATDPDHLIPAGCWVVNYGDGSPEERGPCPTPPPCPPHYGPWTPPPTAVGSFQRLFTHTYSQQGTFTVSVAISSVSADTCLELDPWASPAVPETFTVTITP